MSNQNDNGHSKNVENIGILNSIISTMGAKYVPANPNLTAVALDLKKQKGGTFIMAAEHSKTTSQRASNNRNIELERMDGIVRQSFAWLESSEVSAGVIAHARSLKRKLLAERAEKVEPDTLPENTRSISQRSCDKRIQNFGFYLQKLAEEPLYIPNEPELKVVELQAYLANLITLNNIAIQAKVDYLVKMQERDHELYDSETGLVACGRKAKKYLQSIFKKNSLEYRDVGNLAFRSYRRK